MLISRGQSAGVSTSFQRGQAFYHALRSLDWALESCDGAVGFARVVRRPSARDRTLPDSECNTPGKGV